MEQPEGDPQKRRHSLSDWMALHALDLATCRRLLKTIERDAAAEPAERVRPVLGHAIDLEVAWQRTLEAMRGFLAEQQSSVVDTYEKTAKVVVNRGDRPRKALTLDNGPTAYPTIYYSYRGEPPDCLIIAHEFGHAVQIRASGGKFVAPVMREICAFLGEHALLSHTRQCHAAQYEDLIEAWRDDHRKYYGPHRDRLRAALTRPDAPYSYSWNYPIARYLALQIFQQCSRDWIWSVYRGELSLQDVLRGIDFAPN